MLFSVWKKEQRVQFEMLPVAVYLIDLIEIGFDAPDAPRESPRANNASSLLSFRNYHHNRGYVCEAQPENLAISICFRSEMFHGSFSQDKWASGASLNAPIA